MFLRLAVEKQVRPLIEEADEPVDLLRI
ncbi:MAG: hypothetical protein K0R37_287, partial [Arthrobacter sp.]|nr:hypothetical protein [Arthrobacter sp.]